MCHTRDFKIYNRINRVANPKLIITAKAWRRKDRRGKSRERQNGRNVNKENVNLTSSAIWEKGKNLPMSEIAKPQAEGWPQRFSKATEIDLHQQRCDNTENLKTRHTSPSLFKTHVWSTAFRHRFFLPSQLLINVKGI